MVRSDMFPPNIFRLGLDQAPEDEEKIAKNYAEFIKALREDSFSGFTHAQGRAMAKELLYLLAKIYDEEFREVYRRKYPADDFAIIPMLPPYARCSMHPNSYGGPCSGPFIRRGEYYICNNPTKDSRYAQFLV